MQARYLYLNVPCLLNILVIIYLINYLTLQLSCIGRLLVQLSEPSKGSFLIIVCTTVMNVSRFSVILVKTMSLLGLGTYILLLQLAALYLHVFFEIEQLVVVYVLSS